MTYLPAIPTPWLAVLGSWAEDFMASRAPTEIIRRHGEPYIERWMIGRNVMVPTSVASRTNRDLYREVDDPTLLAGPIANLYLHRYTRDDDEDFHDHPWANGSVIIGGTLIEENWAPGAFQIQRRRLMPGNALVREATECHRIVHARPGTVTLFGTGVKVREWGFWPEHEEHGDERRFVHHGEYRQWQRERNIDAGVTG